MKMTIKIEMENAAFDGANREYETARALRDAADKIENGYTQFSVQDCNGNTIGDVKITGK